MKLAVYTRQSYCNKYEKFSWCCIADCTAYDKRCSYTDSCLLSGI